MLSLLTRLVPCLEPFRKQFIRRHRSPKEAILEVVMKSSQDAHIASLDMAYSERNRFKSRVVGQPPVAKFSINRPRTLCVIHLSKLPILPGP